MILLLEAKVAICSQKPDPEGGSYIAVHEPKFTMPVSEPCIDHSTCQVGVWMIDGEPVFQDPVKGKVNIFTEFFDAKGFKP
jgi:hypothetical protein